MLKHVFAGALLLLTSLVAVGGGWPSNIPLPADHDTRPGVAHAQSAGGGAVEVRVAARRLADGRTEFALQQRDADGSWGARRLPTRRFFPADTDVGRWLSSSPLTVDLPARGDAGASALVVRAAAQLLPDGRMEFALQERDDDGSWADRRLPTRRFFPSDARVGQWLSSSPLAVTAAHVAFAPSGDDVPRLATATIEFPFTPPSTDGATLVSIEPAIEGSFVWSEDHTLLFQPAFPGWQRGQRYVLRVDAAAAGLARDYTHAFTVGGGLEVAYVIPGDGDREVPTGAQVLVQFNRSVAALTVLQEADAPPVLEFDPPLAGKGEWLNTSLYRFVPTDLRPSTTYRVRIPAGLSSAADGVLGSDFTWSFETIQPAVVSFEPPYNAKWVEPDGPFVVTFNQPMDRASVEARVRLSLVGGGVVPLTFAWSDGDTVTTLTPSMPLQLGGAYELVAPVGTAGAAGGVTNTERTSNFTVAENPRLVSTHPRNGDIEAGTGGLRLEYNNPMDLESFEGRISITGIDPDDIRVSGYESRVSVYARLQYSTRYTVRIAAGVLDRGGRVLPAHTFSFTTAARPASLSLSVPSSYTTYSASRPQVLHFHAARIEAARFSLYRLPDWAEERFLRRGYVNHYDEDIAQHGTLVREWEEPVAASLRDQSRLYSTGLSGGEPLPRGTYMLTAGAEELDSNVVFAFSVVDTAIVTKLTLGELLVWALDHDTGEPLSGVEVRATPANAHGFDDPIETSDASGLVRFLDGPTWPSWSVTHGAFVRVSEDGRHGVASTEWDRGAVYWSLGVPAWDDYRPSIKAHLYTDRPIYRPGETVHFKGVIRAEDDATYALPESFGGYSLEIRDAEYEGLPEIEVVVNDLGSFTAEFELPAGAPTGDYRVALIRHNFWVTHMSFTVAEFRVPEFDVEVTTTDADYVAGDEIPTEASAQFYFGGPVLDAHVEWDVFARPTSIRVEGYEDYSFSDYDYYRPRESREPWRGGGEARTDASGVARFDVPATLDDGGGTHEFTISATVRDANAQAVSGVATVTVHPAAWYAGIKTGSYVGKAEEPLGVHLVSADFRGEIAPGRPLTVRVYEREWVRIKERRDSGGHWYRYEPVDTEVQVRRVVTDGSGEASFDFSPPSSGTYRLVAESTDEAGRVARSSRFIWVSGRDFVPWPGRDNDVIELIADREEYEVGDVARVLVPAPFAGATALVTVERGVVMSSEVRTFETNSELLTIPIEDSYIPNVFVGVVLYRGPTDDDPYPRYAIGYVELPVSTARRVLDVRVEPDRDRAAPGETVQYEVTVTDAEGRGVAADVSVAIVDEGVLALAPEDTRDGVDAFWYQRHLGVRTASSQAVSGDRYNEPFRESASGEPGESSNRAARGLGVVAEAADEDAVHAVAAFAGGDPGKAAPTPRTRSNFQRTALWVGQLTTDEDGTATFHLELPDNTTTWRASAQAVTADALGGSGSSELLVTQPLIVRPALPRFLRVGDEVTLRTLVRNGTDLARTVTVTIEADGVTLGDSGRRYATIQPDGSALFEWPARVVTEGTATVRFSATATGGYADAVEISLPVHLDVTPETTATGGVVEDAPAVEAVYLPDYVITGQGSLELSLQGSLVGALADELEHFKPYPDRWESTVRIASRVVAAVAVQRATAGGLDALWSEHLREDVRNLADRQTYVSGWSWGQGWGWCRSCAPDPIVTGWVLFALGEARDAGHDVPDDVIEGATTAIVGYSERETDVERPADPNEYAFLLYALVDASNDGREVSEEARAQAATILAIARDQRSQLTNWGRAYTLLGLLASGHDADHQAVRAMLNDLTADTIASPNGNHWEDERAPGSMHNGSVRITAIVLRALTEVDPQHPFIEETTRWLALGRAADRWKTSVERAQGMASLGAYAQLTGETRGAYDYSVLVNTDRVLAGHFDVAAGDYLDAASVALADLPLGEVSRVQFEREAGEPGRMYYGLNLRYVTPAVGIDALNRGFAVSHRYSLLDDPDTAVTSAAVGDVVRVTVTVVAPADRLFVEVEDFLPAGLEPIDPQLNIVSPWLREQLREDQAEAVRAGDSGYCAPWYRWCYSPWDQVDLRDDRLVLRASELTRGVHEYVYYARATTPGDFFVAPVHAEETYLPEVFGRSDSSRFTVVGGE